MDSDAAAAEQGREAYRAGQAYDANPYSDFTHRIGWATGWRDARDAETERRIAAFNRTYEQNAARRGQYDD